MTHRRLANGVLLEEWDDDARVHGEMRSGAWVTRQYTSEEVAAIPTGAGPDPVQSDLDELTVALLQAL